MNLVNLDALGSEERRLYGDLPVHYRSSDETTESRIRSEYRRVIQQYMSLASGGNDEALKRVVFLWWYSNSEPAHLTGIPEFTSQEQQETADLLRRAFNAGIDVEFERMLAWYYCITDWLFDDAMPDLVPALRILSERAEDAAGIIGLQMIRTPEERGQLAVYFGSMNHSIRESG